MDLFVWLMHAASKGEKKGKTAFRYMDALALLWYHGYLIFTYIFLFVVLEQRRFTVHLLTNKRIN